MTGTTCTNTSVPRRCSKGNLPHSDREGSHESNSGIRALQPKQPATHTTIASDDAAKF